jgi:hypothetical protein
MANEHKSISKASTTWSRRVSGSVSNSDRCQIYNGLVRPAGSCCGFAGFVGGDRRGVGDAKRNQPFRADTETGDQGNNNRPGAALGQVAVGFEVTNIIGDLFQGWARPMFDLDSAGIEGNVRKC